MFRKLVTGEVQGAATKMDYGISLLLRCGYLTPSQLNRDNAAQAPTPTRTIRAENTDGNRCLYFLRDSQTAMNFRLALAIGGIIAVELDRSPSDCWSLE